MEWTDPRYADAVATYEAAKAEAPAPAKRPRRKKRQTYGDPFVVVVNPATLKPYTVAR